MDAATTTPQQAVPAAGRGRRVRSVLARLLLVPLVVLALFGSGIPLYVAPPIDPIPEQADAVFVLGPSTRARVEFARRIITSGATDTMVLSVGPQEMAAPYDEKKYKSVTSRAETSSAIPRILSPPRERRGSCATWRPKTAGTMSSSSRTHPTSLGRE